MDMTMFSPCVFAYPDDVEKMLSSPFLTGFALGFSLILAIGAQRLCPATGTHEAACAAGCPVLRCIGHAVDHCRCRRVSPLIADFAARHAPTMFGLAAIWLGIYGLMRLRSAAMPTRPSMPARHHRQASQPHSPLPWF